MSDRRKNHREDFHPPGLICSLDGSIIDECVLADMSDGGAKLVIDAQTQLPEEFILILSKGAKVHRNCKLSWRKKKFCGVRFVRQTENIA